MGELDSRIKIRAPLRCDGIGRLDCAEDTESGRRMAVRWLPLEANGDAAVKACAGLPLHPTLPTIRQTGQVGGSAFVAMDFPEGQVLGAMLGEPLDIDIVMRVGAQLADVLALVHAQGVVHGELGAESVLLVPPDRAYLWDMPLVIANRLTDRRGEARLMQNLVRMAPFLAPERARGEGASQAGDVYSLGAVLCMAAGAPLPSATTTLGVVHLLATGEWAPRVPSAMSRAERAMVERMISRDPASRPTAREVADALGQQLVPAMPTVREMPAVRLTQEQLVAAGLAPAEDVTRVPTLEIPKIELAAKQAESAAVTPPAPVVAVKAASAPSLAPVKSPSAPALAPVVGPPAPPKKSSGPVLASAVAEALGARKSPVCVAEESATRKSAGPVAEGTARSAGPVAEGTAKNAGLVAEGSARSAGPIAEGSARSAGPVAEESATRKSAPAAGEETAARKSVALTETETPAKAPALAISARHADPALADTLPPCPPAEPELDTRRLPTLEIPRIKKPAVQLTDTISVSHELAVAGAQAVAQDDPSVRATRRLLAVGAVLLAAVVVMAIVAIRLATRQPTVVVTPIANQPHRAAPAAAAPVQDDLAPLPAIERAKPSAASSSAAPRLRSMFRVAHAGQKSAEPVEPRHEAAPAPAPSNDFDFLEGAAAPTSELKRPDL